ncbi:hypothetical protein [Xanthobacter sediminis]
MSTSAFSAALIALAGDAGSAGHLEHLCEDLLRLQDGLPRIEAEFRDRGAGLADLDENIPLDLRNIRLIQAMLLRGPGEVQIELQVGGGSEKPDHFVGGLGDHSFSSFLIWFFRDFSAPQSSEDAA